MTAQFAKRTKHCDTSDGFDECPNVFQSAPAGSFEQPVCSGSGINYSDYRGPVGTHAAVGGKLVSLKAAAPILAEDAMKLSAGGVKRPAGSTRSRGRPTREG
jgi:hypothetical protein